MRRLFIGLMADDKVQAAVEGYRRRWQWPLGARLTPLPNLHLTLHFLGDVDADEEARLIEHLGTAALVPFELELTTPMVWDSGVAVLLPDKNPELLALNKRTGVVLKDVGLPVDSRPWLPHLTLSRRALGAVPPPEAPPIPWSVTRFALVWSTLDRDRGYEVRADWSSSK